MSHSKLPWTYEPQPYKQDAIWAGTRLVANVIGDDAQTEANAAHIVKCVNLHDELVTALEKIALDLDGKIQAADIEDLSFALNTAKDAIAKARVEA